MKWEKYKTELENKAFSEGYNQEEINNFLDYSRKLFDQGLPIIFDQTHLSLQLGVKPELLRKISNAQHKFYRKFEIPKKSGGTRTISEPYPSLMMIQRWILDNILYKLPVSKFAKAYVQKRSIKSNAYWHKNQNFLLTLDITDFFGSIKYSHIYSLYKRIGYSEEVSVMIANLCVLNGSLPQGAPTSPTLSNLVFYVSDKRISSFCSSKKIKYTRYADDMAFSGDFEPGMVIKFVRSVINDIGLKLNEKKIKVRKPHQQQRVTGIVVNNDKLRAPSDLRKRLRQQVYYIRKFGLNSHLDHTNNERANHVYHLLGIAHFILFIDPDDEKVKEYANFLKELI